MSKASAQTTGVTFPVTVGTFPKNSKEELRVNLTEFKGYHLVDLRVYTAFSAANIYSPTKAGVSLQLAKLPALIADLQKAEALAREMGLLVEADEE